MYDQESTRVPDLDALTRLATLEQVLKEAATQMPEVSLAGCMTVVAEIMPRELWPLRPMCSWYVPTHGEHQIATQWVWKDLDSNLTYCHIRCAAAAAIDKANEIARAEGVHPGA